MPPTSSLSWASEVALAIGAVMPGRWASQDSATWAGVAPAPAATFSTAANISGRPRTTASATWAPAAWNSSDGAGANQKTPELKTIVQEIVNRASWASGNALAMIVTGTGHRTAWAFDGNAAQAPLLHVEYSTGPPVEVAPVAGLTVTQVPTPALTVNADGSSSTDNTDSSPIASYRFDFGDGTAAVTTLAPNATATHAYAAAGTYTVTLLVTDTGGRASTLDSASTAARVASWTAMWSGCQ